MQGSFRALNIAQNIKYRSGLNRYWKPGNELKEVAHSSVDMDRIVEIICMTDLIDEMFKLSGSYNKLCYLTVRSLLQL